MVPNELDRALDGLVKAGFAGNKAELARIALTRLMSTLPRQMSHGYDLETAFSPDGRLFQLEYANECTHRGGTIAGVCCSEGVVLAKELTMIPLMVAPNPFLKIFKIHNTIGIVYCGLLPDGYLIVEEALRQMRTINGLDIKGLAEKLFLFTHPFTQRKDMRPLGTSFILGGLDAEGKPRLFLLTSYGYAVEYKACADGMGRESSKGILENEYRDDLSLEEAKALAVKAVLRKKTRAENVLVTAIDAKTKNFTDAAVDERKRLLDRIFT
ncbi:MAG: proteasome subunit alpha [Candidatus Bathyarchaeota archaeon]|nr:MAG: proteasome subunit alpha [Candidatus Bathyarchaeota archaeon]